MSNYARFMCALALTTLALSAQVAPIAPSVQTTAMVGLADAQTAQLNVLNPGILAPALGVICSAAVSFVDANGTVLKSAVLNVLPGKSLSLALRSDIDLKLVAGDRREIRATIAIPPFPPPATASSTPTAGVACKLIPTLEILDTTSGRTMVTLGHVVTIPGLPTANP